MRGVDAHGVFPQGPAPTRPRVHESDYLPMRPSIFFNESEHYIAKYNRRKIRLVYPWPRGPSDSWENTRTRKPSASWSFSLVGQYSNSWPLPHVHPGSATVNCRHLMKKELVSTSNIRVSKMFNHVIQNLHSRCHSPSFQESTMFFFSYIHLCVFSKFIMADQIN